MWLKLRTRSPKDGSWIWDRDALMNWVYHLDKVVYISARWRPEDDDLLEPVHDEGSSALRPKAMWQIGALNPRHPFPRGPSLAQPLRLSAISEDIRNVKRLKRLKKLKKTREVIFEKAIPVPTPPWWAHSLVEDTRRPLVQRQIYPNYEKDIAGLGYRPLRPHLIGNVSFLHIDAVWSISRGQLVTPVSTLLKMLQETECVTAVIVIKVADGDKEFESMSPENQRAYTLSKFPSILQLVAMQVGTFFDIIGTSVVFGSTGAYPGQCPLVNCASSRGAYRPCRHDNAAILTWIPKIYIKLDPVLESSSSFVGPDPPSPRPWVQWPAAPITCIPSAGQSSRPGQ
ncbi:hypothetical protein AK830_g2688 [Neonectria ditissima]|uniref:Uncharacterized protein n=1 Tax=Neonectria ditissima TaxID=78410 RepID=A0A0P7BR36_9HYPO|nr:hypothetical protein AK830_g2688 [Neonectria ditissima]